MCYLGMDDHVSLIDVRYPILEEWQCWCIATGAVTRVCNIAKVARNARIDDGNLLRNLCCNLTSAYFVLFLWFGMMAREEDEIGRLDAYFSSNLAWAAQTDIPHSHFVDFVDFVQSFLPSKCCR